MSSRKWAPSFLEENDVSTPLSKSALIILNQPFSLGLFWKLWKTSSWNACADGGANRLYDLFSGELENMRTRYLRSAFFYIGELNGCNLADFSLT